MDKFQTEYNRLNHQQKEAVDTIEGPVMIIAGPGTGKTQIIAMRIANILKKTQVNPGNILCLTFTNSGVTAMRQRLLDIIGHASYQIEVHTFHAFCNEIISQFPEKFLFANKINQLNDLDQITIIKEILNNNDFKYIKPFKSIYHYQKVIIDRISKLKQENITPEIFKKILIEEKKHFIKQKDQLSKAKITEWENTYNKNTELGKIYLLYQNQLTKEGLYDYDDMILFVLNALNNDDELLNYYQEKFQYILVDEFQDANSAQNEITRLICSFHDRPNIFVVGDDEQSIYRFQGASMENIINFKKNYPDTKLIILKTNYRSGQKILDASRELIKHNNNQIFKLLNIEKKLISNLQTKSIINIAELRSGSMENYFISQEIKKLSKKININNIAVIFRENRDAIELCEYLNKINIPYKIDAGANILEDAEIKKIITLLKIINSPNDENSNQLLIEAMHYQFFKINTLDIYKIIKSSVDRKIKIFEVITEKANDLEIKNNQAVESFAEFILDSRKFSYNNTFSKTFEYIINHSGYLEYILNKKNSADLNRIHTLFKYIQNLNIKNNKLNLDLFLTHIKLLKENDLSIKADDSSINSDGVQLLTAHKAKGLEFEAVFIMHLTDRHFGNNIKKQLIKLPKILITENDSDDNDEEERRLFYVALTRSKRIIYLTYANNYGDENNEKITFPSKFITELPEKMVNKLKTTKITNEYDKSIIARLVDNNKLPKDIEKYIQLLMADFKLSPTALNTYLNCPQQFFFDNILRVPKVKNFSQSYGTAIHSALERTFKYYEKKLILPQKNDIRKWFLESLKLELFSKSDLARAKKEGTKVLLNYYDEYLNVWKKAGPPISCEYNFSYHNVYFKNIPITGRIDKIELISSSANKVRLIDYKTSAPKSLNYILGNTSEKNTDLLYQAYFYKLLSESDPLFRWTVSEVVFDFISDNGFKQVTLPINDDDKYKKFKQLIIENYKKMVNLDFNKNTQYCKRRDRTCDYANICASNNSLIE